MANEKSPFLPPNLSLYMKQFDEDFSVTDENYKDFFSKSDLDMLQSIVASKRKKNPGSTKGHISYDDYPKGTKSTSLIKFITDPKKRLATSLGKFNFEDTPEGLTVTDKYNWNPEYSSSGHISTLPKSDPRRNKGRDATGIDILKYMTLDAPTLKRRTGGPINRGGQYLMGLAEMIGSAFGPKSSKGEGRPINFTIPKSKKK